MLTTIKKSPILVFGGSMGNTDKKKNTCFEDFYLKLREKIQHWSREGKLAKKAGLDGVVASAQEAAILREQLGPEFILVTPGIRPPGSAKNDQVRVLTPREALEAGSSYLVVGRPITQAADPRQALAALWE